MSTILASHVYWVPCDGQQWSRYDGSVLTQNKWPIQLMRPGICYRATQQVQPRTSPFNTTITSFSQYSIRKQEQKIWKFYQIHGKRTWKTLVEYKLNRSTVNANTKQIFWNLQIENGMFGWISECVDLEIYICITMVLLVDLQI